MTQMTRKYRVCHGRLIADDVEVPIHTRVLKIGLVSAGLGDDPLTCRAISPSLAQRILSMERSVLLSGLEAELRAA